MIIYDKSKGFQLFFQQRGSGLKDALPYVLLCCAYAFGVVFLIKEFIERAKEDARIEVPSLQGLAYCAGFMLSMQSAASFKRYTHGMSALMALETQSMELVRHVAMILDVEEQQALRLELRRVLIATLLQVFVDTKVTAGTGAESVACGEEVLRRAVKCGLLSPKDKARAVQSGSSPVLASRAMTAEAQVDVVALMYASKHDAWRLKWKNEATLQPIVNLVKILDSHWKGLHATAAGLLANDTGIAFPLHFMQMSRVLWTIAIVLYPFDLAESMGYTTCGFIFLFTLAYFATDLIGADMGNPFGLHPNAIPLETLLLRVEESSAAVLDATAAGPGAAASKGADGATAANGTAVADATQRAGACPRYDLRHVVAPLLTGNGRKPLLLHIRGDKDALAVDEAAQRAASHDGGWHAVPTDDEEHGDGSGKA